MVNLLSRFLRGQDEVDSLLIMELNPVNNGRKSKHFSMIFDQTQLFNAS